jgi:hypothetical protein
MGYTIHIERRTSDGKNVPITLTEWCEAVKRTTGVRVANGDLAATNQMTGEVIAVRNAGGDAEVFFPEDAVWRWVFRWSPSGRISFRAPDDFSVPTSKIRLLVADLARDLDATLVGDEGEVYDGGP